MDAMTVYKPSIHEHPLFPSAMSVNTSCGCCNVKETIYGGYYCNYPNCYYWFFHKKCIEAPLEINHPYHPGHLLRLTAGIAPFDGCDLCGNNAMHTYYSCSTCEFKVDLNCGMKPSPNVIEHPLCHDHPLAFLKRRIIESPCGVCKEEIWAPSYLCVQCNLYFHLDCVHLSEEVNHHCHSNHPIKLTASRKLTDDAQKVCFSCRNTPKKVLYHCSICNFSICVVCAKNPPPLVLEQKRTHLHPLTLFPKIMAFTCHVCGENDIGGPYVCLQCAFLVHGKCIDLPRVININRHEHRISFTHHLGAGYSKCGVCRKSLSQYRGAYSCSLCPNYVVHCRCAVHSDIWDNRELECIPNYDADKSISPFKVVGDDLIDHFSHKKHPLKMYKNNIIFDKWLQCEACTHPLGFEFYGCEQCGFFLHEKCANLPMKKKLVFSPAPYSLEVFIGVNIGFVSSCVQCGILFDGFKYTIYKRRITDTHCGSLTEPFVHDGHLHPLYFVQRWGQRCDACKDIVKGYMLRCDACGFVLCFYCACLPLKIWQMNDDHPVTLHCGVKEESIKSWCDICERKLDQSKWFYTRSDCEITFHTRCILGDFSRLKPGKIIFYEKRFKVVRNNKSTRPLCCQCDTRCRFLVILKAFDSDNGYICSRSCLSSYVGSFTSRMPSAFLKRFPEFNFKDRIAEETSDDF